MPRLARVLELYTCDFKCGTKAQIKYKMHNHEKHCFLNPINKACRLCKHCESTGDTLRCNKLELYIFPKIKNEVLNFVDEVIWKKKELTDEDIFISMETYNAIEAYNLQKPFPRKDCEQFILGKKVF